MPRNSETLWNSVDLAYFRRLPPFRAMKRWLSFAFAFGAIGWVAALAVREDETPYDSGPPSSAHRLIAHDCFKCHVEPWRGVKRLAGASDADHAMNKACLNCHAASVAYDPASMTARHVTRESHSRSREPIAACSVCHMEHDGPAGLLEISDARCVRCHADLRSVHASTRLANDITEFSTDHPEFRVIADHVPDATHLKLNHAVHLKPNLAGPNRTPVQMTCADCHRAVGAPGEWPYQMPEVPVERAAGAVRAATAERPVLEGYDARPDVEVMPGNGAFMQPIRYALHCGGCHPLVADAERAYFTRGLIPHEPPERIRVFLRGQLSLYADEHPDALSGTTTVVDRGLPTLRKPPAELERLKTAWVNDRIGVIEKTIYRDRKDCVFCHEQNDREDANALPDIVPPDVPSRWFTHAVFSHERHRILACNACHVAAPASVKTSDVLLPNIASCRACHAPRAGSVGGADHRCVLCHSYHHAPDAAASTVGLTVEAITSGATREADQR